MGEEKRGKDFDQEVLAPGSGVYEDDEDVQPLEIMGVTVPLENMFVAFILGPALFGGFSIGVQRALENAKSEAADGPGSGSPGSRFGNTASSASAPTSRSPWTTGSASTARKPPMVSGGGQVEGGVLSRFFLRGAKTPRQVAWRSFLAGTAVCMTTAAVGVLCVRSFFGVRNFQDVRDGGSYCEWACAWCSIGRLCEVLSSRSRALLTRPFFVRVRVRVCRPGLRGVGRKLRVRWGLNPLRTSEEDEEERARWIEAKRRRLESRRSGHAHAPQVSKGKADREQKLEPSLFGEHGTVEDEG